MPTDINSVGIDPISSNIELLLISATTYLIIFCALA
jgi:hypothetical protein